MVPSGKDGNVISGSFHKPAAFTVITCVATTSSPFFNLIATVPSATPVTSAASFPFTAVAEATVASVLSSDSQVKPLSVEATSLTILIYLLTSTVVGPVIL